MMKTSLTPGAATIITSDDNKTLNNGNIAASSSILNRHPMKGRNVVVCCDGTGIGEDHSAGELVTPSNVVKIFNCLATSAAEGDREQIAYYERGVGSVGNLLTKAGQGLTGYGIGNKIKLMYLWLGQHWCDFPNDSQEEDRLYVFGFSRGAFAVRSLVGMINRVGLLDLSQVDAWEAYHRVEIAYKYGYQHFLPQEKWAKGTRKDKNEAWTFHGEKGTERIPVQMIGVFDTVGQLGMPRETWWLFACGALCYFTPKKSHFHDVNMNDFVRSGYHAVAIDEMRSTFQPVFSRVNMAAAQGTKKLEGRRFKQCWFPGGHANVGGGVVDTGLSDTTLKWMIDNATKEGLRFQPKMLAQIKPDYQGNIFHKHGTSLYKNLTYYPRSVPAIIPENLESDDINKIESIHISALQRSQDPRISQAPYFPTTYLQVGEQMEVILSAAQVYNNTYLYMEKGATYDLKAQGMWSGIRDCPCGPDGYHKREIALHPGIWLRTALGRLERACRCCLRNVEARLPLTRRHDRHPWFKVMGMVSCGGIRNAIAEADIHNIFAIGSHVQYTDNRGGYLYCYANDTWSHYTENRGTMILTIRRIK